MLFETPPPRVTALTPAGRSGERVAVHVEGKRVCTLAARHVGDLGLKVGMAWSPAHEQAADHAARVDEAMERALRVLARRPMSTRRLDLKLARLGIEPALRQAAIDRLTRAGQLDDEALARALLREWRGKAAGPALLRAKLQQRGLARELVERLVHEGAADPAEQVEQARSLAQRKARAMAKLDPRTRNRRLWAALARRGYDGPTIEQALRGLGGGDGDETDLGDG